MPQPWCCAYFWKGRRKKTTSERRDLRSTAFCLDLQYFASLKKIKYHTEGRNPTIQPESFPFGQIWLS